MIEWLHVDEILYPLILDSDRVMSQTLLEPVLGESGKMVGGNRLDWAGLRRY